jgi:hypothetical protein
MKKRFEDPHKQRNLMTSFQNLHMNGKLETFFDDFKDKTKTLGLTDEV